MPDNESSAPEPRVSPEVDAVLRDGSTVHLRGARTADREALVTLYESLSLQSRYFGFFGGPPAGDPGGEAARYALT
jgi:hypothetical protein